ncbi:MAG: ASCH domain-containing protein [Pseudomonadota bacterium]
MQFTKKLHAGIVAGEITTSIRIWIRPRVKIHGRYKLGTTPGFVVVDKISEIAFEDITPKMARDSGFAGMTDLLKTAKHGRGERVFYVHFHYEDARQAREN